MHIIEMPTLPDYATWRAAAKAALAKDIPPHQILWQTADMTAPDLFASPKRSPRYGHRVIAPPPPPPGSPKSGRRTPAGAPAERGGSGGCRG